MEEKQSVNDADALIKEPKIKEYKAFENDFQRALAIDEVNMLRGLMQTTYNVPFYDKGNHGKNEERKLTKTVAVNMFTDDKLDAMSTRIHYLTSRLSMSNKEEESNG